MITNPMTFKNFRDVFLNNEGFQLLKSFRFGHRYFYGDVILEVNSIKNKISYKRLAQKKDLEKIKVFETRKNSLNIIYEPQDIYQIFHCLIYNVLILIPLVETIENIDVYIMKKNYDEIFINNQSRFFLKYLNLLTNKKINFIPIDPQNLKSELYYMKDYVVVHIPEKHGFTKEILQIIQKNIKNLEPVKDISKKVYFSRNDKKYKRVPKNEEIIANYFKDKGFSVVDLQDYDVLDQIKITQNAEVIVGWSGSSFSNIFFSNNNKILIDLVYTPNKDYYYGEIDEKLLYTRLPGNIETQMTRYSFDWSYFVTIFNSTYMKINFENIDTCEEVLPILQNNKWLNAILEQ